MTTTTIPNRIFLSDLLKRPDLLFFSGIFDHVVKTTTAKNTISTDSKTLKSKEEVFKLVVNNYVDKIYRYVRHTFNLNKSTADDIVQEIFLSLPVRLKKFDNSRALESRLFKVAHNVALDRIRKESKHTIKEENIDKIEDFIYKISSYQDQDLPENIEKTYKNWLLKVILHKLSERNRELIILFFLENKSYEEIAEVIWVQASGVWTLLSRAKKELKTLVESDPLLLDALVYNLWE